MSPTTPPPEPAARARAPRSRPDQRLRRGAALVLGALLIMLTAGCADFPSEAPTFTVQPSLTARAALPDETSPGVAPSSSPPASPSGSAASPPPSGSAAPADPCAPTDDAVVATCLSAPWGLVPLPDGQSALVGERTTGRILQVAKGADPVLIAQIDGVDASGDGGLLGIALSPSYDEDGLVYAYVSTATDNRIVRVARGDVPKAIFTGIPHGAQHNGGRIAFATDRSLYVGTGDTGNPAGAADPASLAGKVLRLDEFGKPAQSNPVAGSPIYASGFTQVAGICPMDGGTVAALDRRAGSDVLLPLAAGQNYTTIAAGEALWTWTAADGGAADCAIASGLLATTSLDKQQLTGIQLGSGGTFTGPPTVMLDNRYGRLLTVAGDSQGLLWLTTSNKDGLGTPVPSDDRVVVVPSGSSGGEGGPD
ncbi:MAG TPA: PQQ-dependent sugar dehydrogenase [Nakamurella sp.]